MDLENFKLINDTFGHTTGDSVLIQFANILAEETRCRDVVARYGGEKFAILLAECTHNEAISLVQRIREKTEKHDFSVNDSKLDVTVSIGVARITKEENIKACFNRADTALYAAKRQGKNQVVTE